MKVPLLLFLALQVVFSRPVFERDVQSVPDDDGFYRQRSMKRSQRLFALEVTAKLAPGVVSLDADETVEDVRCFGDDILIKTNKMRSWNVGDTLVGGPEWGCVNAQGEPTVISIRISSIRFSEGIHRVSGSAAPMSTLFAHFNLTLEKTEHDEDTKLVARQVAAITFPGFAQTIVPGKPTTIAFTVDTTKIAPEANVTVRWLQRNSSTDAMPIIASVKAGTGSFTWTAPDLPNPVFASTFQLTAGSNVVESPQFWIQKQLAVTAFNTNGDGTSTIPEIPLVDLNCTTASFCSAASNCPSCQIPNRPSFLKWVCRNCTARFNAVVNKFTIQTASNAVTNFTLNATVDFSNDIEYQLQTNFEFVGDLRRRVLTNIPLLTIPTFNIGGIAVNLAMFFDLDLTASIQAPKALINGSLTTTSNAKYSIVYDNSAPITVSATNLPGRPHSPIFANAPMISRFGISPTLRVSIQNNARALAASIEQYYIMDYRFGNPIQPASDVPFPDARYTFGKAVCQQTHFQDTAMSSGIDATGEINFGAVANTTNRPTPSHHASGCNFASNTQDHINLVLQQAAIDQVKGTSVAVELRREIAEVLALPDSTVFISSEDKTNFRVVFIALQQTWGKNLVAEYGKPNSRVFKELLLKDATYTIDDSSSMVTIPSLFVVLLVLIS